MVRVERKELKIGQSFSSALTDHNGAVLIPPFTKITKNILQWIDSRNNQALFLQKQQRSPEKDLEEANKIISDSAKLKKIPFQDVPAFKNLYEDADHIKSPLLGPNETWRQSSSIFKTHESRLEYYPEMDKPAGEPLENSLYPVPESRTTQYKNTYINYYAQALGDIKNIIDRISQGLFTNLEPLRTLTDKIIGYFLKDKNLMFNFAYVKSLFSENLYHHSLNVCILAVNMASSIGYSYKQILEIGMGALLHDLGMIYIPQNIRNKKSNLTTNELIVIRNHPADGLFLISKIKGLPDSTRYIVYQHHEREDGSGYPQGKKKFEVHRFARIVSFADMFEAMTDARPYRRAFNPYDAVREMLFDVRKKKLSPDIMRFFLLYESLFPIGCYVRLNDGRLAKVVDARGSKFVSPVVSVIQSYKRGKRTATLLIDLSRETEIKIVDVVSPSDVPNAMLLEGF